MEILRAKGKGKLGKPERFRGEVYLNDLASVPLRVLRVQFSPKSRTHWHKHPSGQILVIVSGKGRVGIESKGGQQTVREVRAGDIVLASPGERHWHGAAPDDHMAHVAIHVNSDWESGFLKKPD